MTYRKIFTTILFIIAILFITACQPTKVPPSKGGYYYKHIYFGKNFTPAYKKGIQDGCITSTGIYKKSHYLFNTNMAYSKGWFLGRNRCKNLLIIEDE